MTRPDKLRLTGCRCQCPSCGDYFASPRAFDRHRIGAYARPGEFKHSRRCMTLGEMLAVGWCRDARGFLLTPDPRRAGMAPGRRIAPPPATPAPQREARANEAAGRP